MTRGPHEHRPLLADLALPFEAYSAEEALRIIDSDVMIDVLIADHVMPGMIGVDLACAARKWRLRAE
jgi:CheY-like chemotaxis protein